MSYELLHRKRSKRFAEVALHLSFCVGLNACRNRRRQPPSLSPHRIIEVGVFIVFQSLLLHPSISLLIPGYPLSCPYLHIPTKTE